MSTVSSEMMSVFSSVAKTASSLGGSEAPANGVIGGRIFQDDVKQAKTHFIQDHINSVKTAENADQKAMLTDGNELAHVAHVNQMVQKIEEASVLLNKGIDAFKQVMQTGV